MHSCKFQGNHEHFLLFLPNSLPFQCWSNHQPSSPSAKYKMLTIEEGFDMQPTRYWSWLRCLHYFIFPHMLTDIIKLISAEMDAQICKNDILVVGLNTLKLTNGVFDHFESWHVFSDVAIIIYAASKKSILTGAMCELWSPVNGAVMSQTQQHRDYFTCVRWLLFWMCYVMQSMINSVNQSVQLVKEKG